MAFVLVISFLLFWKTIQSAWCLESDSSWKSASRKDISDVTTCVDSFACAHLPDICDSMFPHNNPCPAKCGLCPDIHTPFPLTRAPTWSPKASTVQSTTTKTTPTRTAQAITPSQCTDDFCLHGGVCVVVLGYPVCACPDIVTGTHCETWLTTSATTSPLLETSSPASLLTFTTTTSSTTTASRKPITTIAGSTITTTAATSLCQYNPCLNGGTCRPLRGGFECKCPPGTAQPLCLPAVYTNAPASVSVQPVIPTTTTACDSAAFQGCEKVEVVFLITASRYDSDTAVDHEVDYIKEIISKLRVGPAHVRVAVLVYHDDVHELIHLQADKTSIVDKVERLMRHSIQPSGEPNLAKALEYAKDNTLAEVRSGAKTVLFTIIHRANARDGPGIERITNQLKQECTQIISIVIGVGTAKIDIARKMATSPNFPYYRQYRNFIELENSAGNFNPQCSN